VADTPAKEDWVKEQLIANNLKDTKANRAKYGKLYDERYLGGSSSDWRTYFRRLFPQFASMVDGGDGERKARETFGDLIDLLIDVATNPKNYDLTTQAGIDAFDVKVFATKYYSNTSTARKNWDQTSPEDKKMQIESKKAAIRKRYGFLNLREDDVSAFALYGLQTGMGDDLFDYYVYNQASGGYNILEATPDAIVMRNLARAYNYNPPYLDALITSALTGKPYMSGEVVTLEGLRRRAIDNAKQAYGHLSTNLDSYTLEEIFQPYQDIAADVLELPKTSINLSDPKFSAALRPTKDGQQMTIGDWQTEIMSNPEYGYQRTNKAKRMARNLGAIILEMFGKTGGEL
jgi:hypothetical protein